jgi:hypothetical protein
LRQIRLALCSGFRDDSGFILPLALIVLVVLAALSGALLAVGSTEVPIAANHLRAIQAQYLAEAGLEDAFDAFRVNPMNVATAPTALTPVPSLNGASPTLLAFGNYTVKYQKTGGNTIRVISTGLSADGTATKALTAVYTNNFGGSLVTGILTGGSFTINGNPAITGSCGSVFVNGDLSISGSPTISHDALASGTYSVTSGTPVIGGASGGGQSARAVPAVVPPDFLAAAKASLPANQVFQMKSDGRVLDGNSNLLTTLSSGGTYQYWTYTSGSTASWSLSGNSGTNGTYYFEGNISVSGSPGSALSPWTASLIATGSIDVGGNPTMQTSLTDTLFIAGTDVWIHGNPTIGTLNLVGLVAAHEQVNIQGSVTINGYIVAEGSGASSGLVVSDGLGGNTTINSDCGLISPPLADQLRILSWGQ